MHGIVSISKCAELLKAAGDEVTRSALSRYCDTHGLKKGKSGRDVLVDFEAVQAHRASNYQREVMKGEHLAPVSAEPAPAKVSALPGPSDPARELKQLELRRRQREEALEEGELTATAEVDGGAADAVVLLRSAFTSALHDQAERIAAELQLAPEKVRILRAGLKRFSRLGQEQFAAGLAEMIAQVNEPSSAARARLAELTAHAARLRGARKDDQARTA